MQGLTIVCDALAVPAEKCIKHNQSLFHSTLYCNIAACLCSILYTIYSRSISHQQARCSHGNILSSHNTLSWCCYILRTKLGFDLVAALSSRWSAVALSEQVNGFVELRLNTKTNCIMCRAHASRINTNPARKPYVNLTTMEWTATRLASPRVACVWPVLLIWRDGVVIKSVAAGPTYLRDNDSSHSPARKDIPVSAVRKEQ